MTTITATNTATPSTVHSAWAGALGPVVLPGRLGVVEPPDHDQPEAVEQGRAGQQDRVGAGGPPCRTRWAPRNRPARVALGVAGAARRDLVVGGQADDHVGPDGQDQGLRSSSDSSTLRRDSSRSASRGPGAGGPDGPWSGWGWPRSWTGSCRCSPPGLNTSGAHSAMARASARLSAWTPSLEAGRVPGRHLGPG